MGLLKAKAVFVHFKFMAVDIRERIKLGNSSLQHTQVKIQNIVEQSLFHLLQGPTQRTSNVDTSFLESQVKGFALNFETLTFSMEEPSKLKILFFFSIFS